MSKTTKTITRMIWMLIGVGVLFGAVFIFKMIEKKEIAKFAKANQMQIYTISALQAQEAPWQSRLTATGSLRTVKGVNVTTQLSGMVVGIYFNGGEFVKKDTLLVQLNIDPDVAKLHALEAEAAFAKITYDRNKRQYKIGAVSAEQLASDDSNFKSTAADVAQQEAVIAEKTIRAPFAGKLGISLINPGQYLNPGDSVVVLQTLDPIYVDFNVPQESLSELKLGEAVSVAIDSFQKQTFKGEVTTINPEVDDNTRNVVVEGTLPNPKNLLLPGMFVNVELITGSPKNFITLPQAAITYNPYGDYVYVLKKTNQQKNGKPVWQANQVFVTTGDTRGDQISVLKGVQVGDWIVTSGQLKLQNGSLVIMNNTVQPSDNPDPRVTGE